MEANVGDEEKSLEAEFDFGEFSSFSLKDFCIGDVLNYGRVLGTGSWSSSHSGRKRSANSSTNLYAYQDKNVLLHEIGTFSQCGAQKELDREE